jgi:hypothetical protein
LAVVYKMAGGGGGGKLSLLNYFYSMRGYCYRIQQDSEGGELSSSVICQRQEMWRQWEKGLC